MSRIQELLLMVCSLSVLAIFIMFGVLGIWHIFPPDPVYFDKAKIKITTPKVKAGEELNFTVPVEKYGIYPAVISTTIVSKDKKRAYSLEGGSGALLPGKYSALNVEVRIPKRVDPGIYQLNRIYLYTVKPNITVVKSYITPEFEVIQ